MSWTVTIPGQPISGNHAWKIGRGYRSGGIAYPKIIKTAECEAYQQGIALLVRTARPSGWKWDGESRLRIVVKFYLTRLVDADNLLKVLLDGLKYALDVDDRYFNPCVEDVVIVKDKGAARVEVLIDPGLDHCHEVLGKG